MNEQAILDYLNENPDFFQRHPEQLHKLPISHPDRGTISLTELHLDKMRQQIAELQDEITALMEAANHNEQLFHLYADLYVTLPQCRTLGQLQQMLEQRLTRKRRLSACKLLLNPQLYDDWPEFILEATSLQKIQTHRLAQGNYFGRLSQMEQQLLFGENTPVNSVALMTIGPECQHGVLAFASADSYHFTPGMDPLLLELLGRMIAVVLPKMVPLREQK